MTIKIETYKNRPSEMKLFWCHEVFFGNFDSKNGCKMNLRIITKNRAADPAIMFLTKSILRPYGRATAMPTALELKI